MRPTTSTTNKKTSGKSQILKTPFVSSPFRDQNSIQQFLWLVVSEVLPTQDIILNEIASGESNLVILRSLFWRKLRCKFVIEKEKNWLIDYLHHGYGWSRIYVKLWQVGPYSYWVRNYVWTERREADLLIGNGKRIYETQVTKSRNAPLLIEVARCRYKGGSVNLRLRTRWPETEKLYDTLQLKLLEGRYANS